MKQNAFNGDYIQIYNFFVLTKSRFLRNVQLEKHNLIDLSECGQKKAL